MKRWLISCSLICLAPTSVLAQTAKIQGEIETELSQARAYEDIEIMRRLLQRKLSGFAQSCQQCHQVAANEAFLMFDRSASMPSGRAGGGGSEVEPMSDNQKGGPGLRWTGWNSFHHHGQHAAASESIPVDGHYVKGAGVVMQAQLPASILQFMPASPTPKKQPPPPSEWEVIRRQLRGEKVDAPVAQDDPHARISQGANIQDVLVQLVAEHGKHFQSLGDNERLTLTVTFRPSKYGSVRSAGGDSMGGMAVAGEGGMMGGGGSGPMVGMVGGGAPKVGPRSSSKDYELLADFHLRQGRYAEAGKTLEKAIELNTDKTRTGGLYRKLASALLLQDSNAANAQYLEKVNELLRKAQTAKPAPAPLKTALPTRLIISAPRSALQNASAGSLDEFRRQITVTWLRFNHPVLRQPADIPGGSEDGSGNPSK